MAKRQAVNLNDHMNANVVSGHPADFPVALEPVFYEGSKCSERIPSRRAVVRQDIGQAIAIVSNRYALVSHSRILDVVERAIEPLDVGPVPRGIYVDRQGARMRAVFKFPALAQPVLGTDDICPCVQVRNAYDGSERISVHIGAFRFVCTNLAVGGGGVFAGGFVSIHAGDIPIEDVAGRLQEYLTRFDAIVSLYRQWSDERLDREMLETLLKSVLRETFPDLRDRVLTARPSTVFDAYNGLTHHATHSMRSARAAFDMLERVNSAFQHHCPRRGQQKGSS